MVNWMQMRSGFAFILDDPASSAEAMPVSDIFYSQARQPRYKGHTKWPYTVSQHVVLLVDYAVRMGLSEQVQRALLWHDAEEAVIGDIPTPVKRHYPAIAEYGDALRAHFLVRFGLPEQLSDIVHELDARILLDERKALCGDLQTLPWNLPYTEGLGIVIEPWPSEEEDLARLRAHFERLHPPGEWLPEGVYPTPEEIKDLDLSAHFTLHGISRRGEDRPDGTKILPDLTVRQLIDMLASLVLTRNEHLNIGIVRDLRMDPDPKVRIMGDLLFEGYRRR